jgi:hypothetical protein
MGMFQTVWRVVFVLMILTAAGNLFAQTKGPSSLAGLVLSDRERPIISSVSCEAG